MRGSAPPQEPVEPGCWNRNPAPWLCGRHVRQTKPKKDSLDSHGAAGAQLDAEEPYGVLTWLLAMV
eukprot:scaffold74326_cov24-Phaeocystis_antarctica.AAC.1